MVLLPSTRCTLALCEDHGKAFRKGEKKCMQSPEQSQNHALELPRWRGRNRAACFRPFSPNILTRETPSQACELFAIRTFGLRYIKQASRPRPRRKISGDSSWAPLGLGAGLAPNPPGLSSRIGNAGAVEANCVSGLVRRRLRLVGTAVRGTHGEGPRELGSRGRALSQLTELAV
jgi:hypothetical protein